MVSPVSGIPVAAETIQPKTLITSDMIEYIDVAPIVLQKGMVITDGNAVVGKYSNYNTVIPQGSMFYLDVVVDKSVLPDSAFIELNENEVPYNLLPVKVTYCVDESPIIPNDVGLAELLLGHLLSAVFGPL